ncbi:hypothetical protein THTE_3220 [Thermogutta terrifontis]|uniref:Uncharacterized protein n=1 Tax=Thermogutta terrifontis TaxID=1331910 RepID=A0A286RIS1_9BACT|nr:hypothetical protein THTE_3220 [Thermogutta terrifontis]
MQHLRRALVCPYPFSRNRKISVAASGDHIPFGRLQEGPLLIHLHFCKDY